MSALAAEHNAVNLGQGFPDFPMHDELIARVNEAMLKGFNQYVHMNGYMPLREILSEKIFNLYAAEINPDTEITVTPGGTYAIYTALTSVLRPGDEVIVFGPEHPITDLAKDMGTIAYEVLTNVSRRVKRVYYQE